MDASKVGKSLLKNPKLQTQRTLDSANIRTTTQPQLVSAEDKKKILYEKECNKLHVTPVGSYLRQLNKPELAIRNYPLGPEGVKALAVPLMVDNKVVKLDLEGNAIGPEGLSYLFEFLLDGLVHCLNLAGNNLGSNGAILMRKLMTANHFIDTLNLSGNGFVDDDSGLFATIILENKQLRHLDLSHNSFGSVAAREFSKALSHNETLEHLDISWNHIRKQGAVQLCEGIKENIGLRTLNASFNGFATEGLVAMADALCQNQNLEELDLSHNRILDNGIPKFSESLRKNQFLKVLKIGDNPMTGASALELIMAVENGESALVELDLQNVGVDEYFVKVMEAIQEKRNFKAKYGRLQRIQWKSVEISVKDNSDISKSDSETEFDPVDGVRSMSNVTPESRSFDDEDFEEQSEFVTTAIERQPPSLCDNDEGRSNESRTSALPYGVTSPSGLTPSKLERETSDCSLRSAP